VNEDAYLVAILLTLFFIAISVISFYLMPRFDNFFKALAGSFLIPYLSIVAILVLLMSSSLAKKIQYKGWLSIFTILKECFFSLYLNSGLFITTIAIFAIWFYGRQKQKSKIK
jgi:hypothetical protein